MCLRDCWGACPDTFPPTSPERDQEEERRLEGKNKRKPHSLACPGAFHSAAPRPPRALRGRAEPPAAAEPALLASRGRGMPLRVQHAACLQYGCGDCGWRGVLPLLGANPGMADAPFPAARAASLQNLDRARRRDAQHPRVSVRIPRRFCSRCGSPLGRVDRLPLGESPSE